MKTLDLNTLSNQFEPPQAPPIKPTLLEDRGDGQATQASLEQVLRWIRGRDAGVAVRDDDRTMRAIQSVIDGVAACVMARTRGSVLDVDVSQATAAAAWLISSP